MFRSVLIINSIRESYVSLPWLRHSLITFTKMSRFHSLFWLKLSHLSINRYVPRVCIPLTLTNKSTNIFYQLAQHFKSSFSNSIQFILNTSSHIASVVQFNVFVVVKEYFAVEIKLFERDLNLYRSKQVLFNTVSSCTFSTKQNIWILRNSIDISFHNILWVMSRPSILLDIYD